MCMVARGIVWSSAVSDFGEGMPMGSKWNVAGIGALVFARIGAIGPHTDEMKQMDPVDRAG